MHALLQSGQRRLAVACRSLDTISPLATLQRGYAIVSRPGQRQILRKAAELRPGEQVETRLAEGSLLCTVDKVSKS
jgi:exodeoxyribonuclease VII large subunit